MQLSNPVLSLTLFALVAGSFLLGLGLAKYFLRRQSSTVKTPESVLKWFLGSKEGAFLLNENGFFTAINQGFEAITGYPATALLGKQLSLLQSSHHEQSFYQQIWQTLQDSGEWEGQIWLKLFSNNDGLFRIHLSRQSQTNGFLGIIQPIAESYTSRSTDALEMDNVTHIESRHGFLFRLEHNLEEFDWNSHSIAIVAVDIANFKKINSSFGHLAGDTFLELFATRLLEHESEEHHFARLGGDEFLVEIRQKCPVIQLQPFFDIMTSIVKNPIQIHDESLFLSLFMGVAIAEPELNAEMLVKQADIALHQAKQQKTPYIVFDGKMQKQAMQDLTLSKKLKVAIESSIIDVFYQPKIDLSSKKIVGMEALARWKDEQGKFIPPGVFIPLAEKNGLINHLFQIIVAKTIKDMARIFLPIQPQIMVSINLSAHQFEIQDLVQEITCRVDHENIPRERFEFEVTESVFIANMEKTRATLQQFKQEGFQLSLDDFGTGFSSLTYLNYLPFDTLKIDKSFVDPVPLDPRMNALTRSIINLSHAINLHCVAEGVETKDQMEFLAELGCDFCQGYFYSPPVHRDAFEQLLRKQNS